MEAAMNRLRKFGVVAFAYVVLAGGSAASIETATDTNVVTGLDFSHSVSLDEHWIVQDGLARALLSPEILQAIQAGRHGRIGLALFGWHTTALPLLPWMLVSSAGDAELAVQRIRAAFIEQIAAEATLRRVERRFGRPTDLSHGLSSASVMLLAAPFRSKRSVINIIGNGPDNVNEDAPAARDAALALGFTINGVVLGYDPDVIDYFRQKVVGGPGSFVEHVPSAEMMGEVFRRKFINDIVIGFADGSEPEPSH
jgi:Ca-activated chloride channel homolog